MEDYNKAAPFFDIDKNDEINSFEVAEFTQFKLIQRQYNLTPLRVGRTFFNRI